MIPKLGQQVKVIHGPDAGEIGVCVKIEHICNGAHEYPRWQYPYGVTSDKWELVFHAAQELEPIGATT